MGQKVHPYGFRLGVVRDWQSRWYADTEYREFVIEDAKLRKYLRRRLPSLFAASAKRGGGGRGGGRGVEAGVSAIEIERMANMIKITLHTARPGMIIGRGGRGIDDLRAELEKLTPRKIQLNVMEIKQPELDAQLVSESISSQVERRVSFKRAIRLAIARTMQRGGKGIKVIISGRLGGAEIARRYSDKDGKVPLHTLRADIDFGMTEAKTQYGNIGVKVWIYRGEILPGIAPMAPVAVPRPAMAVRPPAPAPEAGAPPSAGPAPAGEKKAKGWRRVPREAAGAMVEVTAEGESPEEFAGSVLTPEETLEETIVASANPEVEEVPAAPEVAAEAATPETDAEGATPAPTDSDDDATSPGEPA